MSGDVVATIKEHLWMVTLFGLLLALLSACFGSGWMGRGVGWTFALTRARKLDRLRKRRDRLVQLHESDREYYGWLLSGVLSVLGLFAGQLVLEGVMLGPSRFGSPEQQWMASLTVAAGRYVIGLTAYFGAAHLVQGYRALRRFDRTMERLDRRIAILEARTSLQTAPTGIGERTAS